MSNPSEPRNPFYLLLLLASLVFVVTALAYGLVPVLEEKAAEAGNPPPPSAFRDALRADGWKWLLIEVAVMAVLSLLSMGLDRLRSLQKERAQGTIPPAQGDGRSPSP
jgi:hypothetical protein